MRLGLTAFATVLALPAAADVARPETLEDTLGILAGAYRATGLFETVEIDVGERRVELTGPDGYAVTSFPDNIHLLLQSAENEGERREILDEFVAAMSDHLLGSTEQVPDSSIILPLVRSADFGLEVVENRPISDPLVGDLRVFYAFDHPNSFSYVTTSSLEEVGLERADLAPLARANFETRGWTPELEGDGIWFLVFDGNFEASFLLNDALWNGFDETLGTVLMLALARDVVVFTDADFEGAEAEMRRMAEENYDQLSYPLSQLLFEWTSDGWKVR